MHGMTDTLSIGQRVRWYRIRRGLSQEALAGLVGRTVDWLGKAERGVIPLDRLPVIKALADALDVSLGDLLAEPSLVDWTPPDAGPRTVPALRDALMDYRQITRLLGGHEPGPPPPLDLLSRQVADVWTSYQEARFSRVTRDLPAVLSAAQLATREYHGDNQARAHGLLALTYQAAAMTLTKVGETDLAWTASDRGLAAAERSGDPVVLGSLFRSVAHSLLSTGQYTAAVRLTTQAADYLRSKLALRSPGMAPQLTQLLTGPDHGRTGDDLLSVYGTLFLAGAMAAARAEDRATTRDFLAEADHAARRLGRDGNQMWTSFGPTNVAIHRVATAAELGDMQVAADLDPQLDTSALTTERRVRHALQVARALSTRNRQDQALDVLLDAEQLAPEQVRYHFLSRQLVLTWVRNQRGKPPYQLDALAKRLRIA
jgi:transcriptional regulator with XRE-family HTH domain